MDNTDMEQYLQNQRKIDRKRECFGDAYKWYSACFEGENGLVPAISYAKYFVNNWRLMQETAQGMVFWGPPGRGKTHAAACIANDILDQPGNTSVKMFSFGLVLHKLYSMSLQEKARYLTRLLTYDLLILDDIGLDHQSDHALEQLQTIVDGRYVSKQPLIVTTNLHLDDMHNPDSIQKERIYSRLLEICVPIFFNGEDLRRITEKERLLQFKQAVKR